MIETLKNGTLATRFEDTTEMLQVADQTWKENRLGIRNLVTVSEAYNEDARLRWYGRTEITSWDRTQQMLTLPWADGLRAVDEARAALDGKIPKPVNLKRRMRWTDDEGELDVTRYLAGECDVYRRPNRRPITTTKNITLLANLGGNANVSSSELLINGAAVVALTDLLEAADYTVELLVWNGTSALYPGSNVHAFYAAWMLKAAGTPVDTHTMINAMSAWLYRTAGFVFTAYPKHLATQMAYNLGRDESFISNADLNLLGIDTEHGKVLRLPAMRTTKDAIHECSSLIAQLEEGQ